MNVLSAMARAESYCLNSPLNGALDAFIQAQEAREIVTAIIEAGLDLRDCVTVKQEREARQKLFAAIAAATGAK